MTPILGIWASSTRQGLSVNAFESIATATVTSAGGTATLSFTSIPNTYKHLQIRGMARTLGSPAGGDYTFIRINSDTGTNYTSHYMMGTETTRTSGAYTTQTGLIFPQSAVSAADPANLFAIQVLEIYDYTNTNKYKTLRGYLGQNRASTGSVTLQSGNWRNTNAITRIDLVQGGGTAWAQYTTFALYGIKG